MAELVNKADSADGFKSKDMPSCGEVLRALAAAVELATASAADEMQARIELDAQRVRLAVRLMKQGREEVRALLKEMVEVGLLEKGVVTAGFVEHLVRSSGKLADQYLELKSTRNGATANFKKVAERRLNCDGFLARADGRPLEVIMIFGADGVAVTRAGEMVTLATQRTFVPGCTGQLGASSNCDLTALFAGADAFENLEANLEALAQDLADTAVPCDDFDVTGVPEKHVFDVLLPLAPGGERRMQRVDAVVLVVVDLCAHKAFMPLPTDGDRCPLNCGALRDVDEDAEMAELNANDENATEFDARHLTIADAGVRSEQGGEPADDGEVASAEDDDGKDGEKTDDDGRPQARNRNTFYFTSEWADPDTGEKSTYHNQPALCFVGFEDDDHVCGAPVIVSAMVDFFAKPRAREIGLDEEALVEQARREAAQAGASKSHGHAVATHVTVCSRRTPTCSLFRSFPPPYPHTRARPQIASRRCRGSSSIECRQFERRVVSSAACERRQ